MKKALLVTWSGFQDQEVVFPYYRLIGAGFQTDIVGDKRDPNGRFYGILGVNMPCTVLIEDFHERFSYFLEEYDLLVLPGGVKSLEKLRQDKKVLDFIFEWNKMNKVIASTCHGAQLLISAKVLRNRKVSGYYSIKDDIENAGATYASDPVVTDGNIISSPHYDFMGEWMETVVQKFN